MKAIVCLLFCLCVGVGSLCGIEPAEFKALKIAAEKGDREAMFQLSNIYDLACHDFESKVAHLNADKDGNVLELCQMWLRKAAERGHPEAMFVQAELLRFYSGQDKMPEAIDWMKKSAEAGWASAMMEMAKFHAGEDDEVSADWYKKAAAANHPPAFDFLAQAYLRGVGVPYNPKRAIEWLIKGTQATEDPTFGNGYATHCMVQLGKLHLEGKHAAKDEAAAAKWLRLAADAGNPEANLPLAGLLVRGAGVPRDLAKARELLETSPAQDHEKQPVFAALATAEKAEAEARSMRERVADLAPRVGSAWADRLLAPPPELAGMEPVDVLYLMNMRVAPPAPGSISIDWGNRVPGTVDFSSMRMSLAASDAEADEAQRNFATRYGAFALRIRGSDLTGGRIMLGWTAWISVSDWWPDGYGYPNEGVGYCYGAASLDEALKVAYASALRGLRKNYQGPIRCIQVEAGISAKPKWDLYRANKTLSDVVPLTYSFCLETPSNEKEAQRYGFTMSAPEDPEEFPHFARVTMRQRKHPQVIRTPGVAPGDPRFYGSYGLMNATIPINPLLARTKEQVIADGFPEYFFKELYLSDEPSAFQVLPGSN
jgi:TPR repeat protein